VTTCVVSDLQQYPLNFGLTYMFIYKMLAGNCWALDVFKLYIIAYTKVILQGKLFQKCTHLLYCSVLSLGGNVYTRGISKPDMGSIFHLKNQWNILVIGNYYVNYQNYQNLMLLTSSDTKQTLMHLFLFTNSAQRELVSIFTPSIRNWN